MEHRDFKRPRLSNDSRRQNEREAAKLHLEFLRNFNRPPQEESYDRKTVEDLRATVERQAKYIDELKKKNKRLEEEMRRMRNQFEMDFSSFEDPSLISALAMNSGIDIEEIRHQQHLWEHRNCQSGHCFHHHPHEEEMTYEEMIELGNRIGHVEVGLTHAQIQAIPSIFVENASCSICQMDIENQTAKLLPCGHSYHQQCITRWLTSKNKCPVCLVEL